MTIKDEMVKWLKIYKRGTIKVTSFDTVLRTASNYIIKYIGNMILDEITSDDVQLLLTKLDLDLHLSFSIRKKVYNVLCEFYRHLELKYEVKNIMNVVVRPKEKKKRGSKSPRALTILEIQKFIKAALRKKSNGTYESMYGPALVVYLFTGIRLGELCGLKLSDYDRKRGILHINSDVECIGDYDPETLEFKKGITLVHQDTPKSYNSDRYLQVNETAKKYLDYYYVNAVKCGSEYLICNTKYTMTSPSSLTSAYYSTIKKAQITNANGIHTLRHTFATHLLRNQTNIKIVSEALGHSSVKVTYDTYIHTNVEPDDIPSAFKILDTVFSKSYIRP